MKTRYARLATAILGSPLAGLFTVFVITTIEHSLYGPAANQDNAAIRAHEIVGPLLKPLFVILCWVYVVPSSWFLTRAGVPAMLAAFFLTVPVWVLATALLRSPDPFPITTAMFGVLVGLPVFSAALVATAALRPGKSAPPNGEPTTSKHAIQT